MVFKVSRLYFLGCIIGFFVIFVSGFMIWQYAQWVGVIPWMVLFGGIISIVFTYLISQTKVKISDDKISSTGVLGSGVIDFSDIVSMSISRNLLVPLVYYQIKTKNKSLKIPLIQEKKDFEKRIMDKADLEVHEESALYIGMFVPNLKRWKKRNNNYEATSTSDFVNNLYYNKVWFTKVNIPRLTIYSLILAVVVLAILFVFREILTSQITELFR